MKLEHCEVINGAVVQQQGGDSDGLRVLVDDREDEGFAVLYIVDTNDNVRLKIQVDAVNTQAGSYVDIAYVDTH